MQRRRVKHAASFEDRLAAEAKRLRELAKTMAPGAERDELIRKARQAETACRMNAWLSLPGLQPPN